MKIESRSSMQWKHKIRWATCATFMVGVAACSGNAWALPTFARQTGWSCATCHTSYPQLTPMGRMFKLLGYTSNNVQRQQKLEAKFGKSTALLLMRVSQFSIFFQASYANVAGGQAAFNGAGVSNPPGNQNDIQFPQQVSLFYAGEITPHIGAFLHLTYSGRGGFGMDDSDIRWAHPWNLGPDQLLITGVEVNNTPTEPDIYNTVPDWYAPFSSSKYSAIRQIPTTFIEGAHGAGFPLAGIGTYEAYIFGQDKANWLYFEADGYTNADGIGVQPNSGGAFGYANDGRMQGVAPYVRLAYQRDWGNWNWEVGTYGMWSRLYDSPNTKGGPVDSFDDYDLDSQLQWLDTTDNSNVTLHADWIHEDQTFGPGTTLSSSATGNLNSLNINGSYWYHDHYGVSGGYLDTWGSANPDLWGTSYSHNGSPDTNGEWIEASYLPWWNTRFSLRYTMFNQFRGLTNSTATSFGASAYNTLELLTWISF
ncbi:cytochrome C [Acidithiobacillus ferrooxidans]|uniref:cytochrome C n=1 Tax=Acidithiobacillus ferrooxidans TaxID=920 RepID=UPI0013D12E6E|nr:cytochrome C [Acidithiobacillus ferrooxidans]MCR2828839.1 cytochrome C [Acidithiobacillus ferrooxidans]